jgi:hypothetical protein
LDANEHAFAHADGDLHCHTNLYDHFDLNAYANAFKHAFSNADFYRNRYIYCECDQNGDPDPNADL